MSIGDEISEACHRALGGMSARLLERSHRMEPGGVFAALAQEAAAVGLDDLQVYLIDKQQAELIAMGEGSERCPVVGTVLGDTYSHRREHSSEEGGITQVTLPLVDGEDRLGVIVATTSLHREEALAIGRTVASLTAEMVETKDAYTDEFESIRRTETMSLAAEMRWALLPPLTFLSPRVSVAGILTPCYSVAGDAFDYAINGDILHVGIFDAVGHGLEAACIASLAISAYRHARRSGSDLWQTGVSIDQVVADQYPDAAFLTTLLAELNLETGRLRWHNFGHPRPILLRNGKIVADLLTEPIPPLGLGLLPDEASGGEVRLEPRDSVLFFSDGITEARSPSGEFFGASGLADHIVRSAATNLTHAEALRRLTARLAQFQDGPSRDDATLLLVTWLQARD